MGVVRKPNGAPSKFWGWAARGRMLVRWKFDLSPTHFLIVRSAEQLLFKFRFVFESWFRWRPDWTQDQISSPARLPGQSKPAAGCH